MSIGIIILNILLGYFICKLRYLLCDDESYIKMFVKDIVVRSIIRGKGRIKIMQKPPVEESKEDETQKEVSNE